MNIEPNLVLIGIQAVPFFVTLISLYLIIFKPMLAYLDEREEAMTKGREEAEELQKRISEDMDAYKKKLAAARREVGALRKQRRGEAAVSHEERVQRARTEAEAEVAEALVGIHKEFEVARGQLATTADALANDIAGQVLGRPLVAPSPSQPPTGAAG